MLQDGISRDDVQFYTDIDQIDCDDRNHVIATRLIKPRVIHPIKYCENLYAAVHQMVVCYKNGFENGPATLPDSSQGPKSSQPFMVFSSSLVMAEFLVIVLKEAAPFVQIQTGFMVYGAP